MNGYGLFVSYVFNSNSMYWIQTVCDGMYWIQIVSNTYQYKQIYANPFMKKVLRDCTHQILKISIGKYWYVYILYLSFNTCKISIYTYTYSRIQTNTEY